MRTLETVRGHLCEAVASMTDDTADVWEGEAGGTVTFGVRLSDGRVVVVGDEDGPFMPTRNGVLPGVERYGVTVYACEQDWVEGLGSLTPEDFPSVPPTAAGIRAAIRAHARYVVLYADGMTPIVYLQAAIPDPSAAVSEGLAARTLAEAVEIFHERIRATYRDDVATDDGGPWADVVSIGAWDGATYGQDTPAVRLAVGPRGGIRRERI